MECALDFFSLESSSQKVWGNNYRRPTPFSNELKLSYSHFCKIINFYLGFLWVSTRVLDFSFKVKQNMFIPRIQEQCISDSSLYGGQYRQAIYIYDSSFTLYTIVGLQAFFFLPTLPGFEDNWNCFATLCICFVLFFIISHSASQTDCWICYQLVTSLKLKFILTDCLRTDTFDMTSQTSKYPSSALLMRQGYLYIFYMMQWKHVWNIKGLGYYACSFCLFKKNLFWPLPLVLGDIVIVSGYYECIASLCRLCE